MHALPRQLIRPGDEQRMTAVYDSCRDCGNLLWCLAQPEYHFGESLPNRPVVVHPGKSEILERLVPERPQQLLMREIRLDPPFAHGVEQHP
jgi:hypothetical protein